MISAADGSKDTTRKPVLPTDLTTMADVEVPANFSQFLMPVLSTDFSPRTIMVHACRHKRIFTTKITTKIKYYLLTHLLNFTLSMAVIYTRYLDIRYSKMSYAIKLSSRNRPNPNQSLQSVFLHRHHLLPHYFVQPSFPQSWRSNSLQY